MWTHHLSPFRPPSLSGTGIHIELPPELHEALQSIVTGAYYQGALTGGLIVGFVLVVLYLLSSRKDGARLTGLTILAAGVLWYLGTLNQPDPPAKPPARPVSPAKPAPEPPPRKPLPPWRR